MYTSTGVSAGHLLELLATEVETDTVIEDEGRTSLAAGQQSRSQSACDREVKELRGLARIPAISFGTAAHPPAVEVDEEDDIVDNSVGYGNLDTGYHGALLLASLILLPRSTIL